MQGKPFVHFLHIGKTGGTAVGYAIEKHSGWGTPYAVCLHGHGTVLRDVPEGEKFFFFVRDPVTRFVSSFYSRQRQGRPRYFWPWTAEEAAAFARFATANQLALALSSPSADERSMAEMAMNHIRHVRDSYWKWFVSETYFLSRVGDLFFIGYQEALASDFDLLRRKLCLPGDAALPDDDLLAHRSPRHLDRRLEERAIANLHEWYGDDFRFLDLCRRILRDHPEIRGVPAGKGP